MTPEDFVKALLEEYTKRTELSQTDAEKIKMIKSELLVHTAKAILTSATSSFSGSFQIILGVSTFMIPAYPSFLKFLNIDVFAINYFWLICQVVLWTIGILISLWNVIPRSVSFDMKNVPGIIQVYENSARATIFWSRCAGAAAFLGAIVAAYVIAFVPTAFLPMPPEVPVSYSSS